VDAGAPTARSPGLSAWTTSPSSRPAQTDDLLHDDWNWCGIELAPAVCERLGGGTLRELASAQRTEQRSMRRARPFDSPKCQIKLVAPL